jgi:hypothetical protein
VVGNSPPTSSAPLPTLDFYTFCLERNEGLGFGKTYNYTTSNAAEAGGRRRRKLLIRSPRARLGCTRNSPTAHSPATAIATAQRGIDNARTRAASGRDLQNAIWALEDEQAVDNTQHRSSKGSRHACSLTSLDRHDG